MNEWKERVRAELVTQSSEVRGRLLEKAKDLIQITDDGDVDFRCDIVRLRQTDKILLYMIGKWFSKEIEMAPSDAVSYAQLTNRLGIPVGTVKSSLFALSRKGSVEKAGEAAYRVRYTKMESIIDCISRRLRA